MQSDPKTWSLIGDLRRRQLGLLAGFWITGTVIAIAFVVHETNEMFDNALAEVANLVAALDANSSAIDSSAIAKVALAGDRKSYMSYQVRDQAGQVLVRSFNAPQSAYTVPLDPGFTWYGDTRYLTRDLGSGRFVQVAEFYDERRDAFLGLLAGLLLPLLVLLAVSSYLLGRAATKVGAPIAALSVALRNRGGANLQSVDVEGAPVELQPIVAEANALLERVRSALEAEKEFSANCAHELRNPIASARGQVELLQKFPDDPANAKRLSGVGDSLRSLSHRIERLLQLSRVEAGAGNTGEGCDLIAITDLLVGDYTSRGNAIKFDRNGRDTLLVAVDQDAVGIALQNLIDNALAHAAPGASIEIRVDTDGALRITNDCKPVDGARLVRLTERFQRERATPGGYGLGLSIVNELMQQSGGTLELRSPATGRTTGFEAIIAIPAASEP